jgi:hypothetical protein
MRAHIIAMKKKSATNLSATVHSVTSDLVNVPIPQG